MIRIAADENFNGHILDGLQTRLPTLDVIRIQDTPMYQSADSDLLEWLARENWVLLTHDAKTMPGFVYERVHAGLPVPGVVLVIEGTPVGQAIDELEIVIGIGEPTDFINQVRYIPLR